MDRQRRQYRPHYTSYPVEASHPLELCAGMYKHLHSSDCFVAMHLEIQRLQQLLTLAEAEVDRLTEEARAAKERHLDTLRYFYDR